MARRGEQQPIAHMRRIVGVLLKARDTDLLVVRVVLEAAGGERHGGHVGLAVRARFQIGAGGSGRPREIERHDRLVERTQELVRGPAREIEPGGFLFDDRRVELVLVRHVVDEIGHEIKDARLVRVVRCPHPVVRDVAIVEGILAVGELPRHRRAQDRSAAPTWIVAKALDRYPVLQMRRDEAP